MIYYCDDCMASLGSLTYPRDGLGRVSHMIYGSGHMGVYCEYHYEKRLSTFLRRDHA